MVDHPEKTLSDEQRKAIFLALVEAQDRAISVAQSRKVVAEQFNISEQRVRQIEREGLDGNWPPLG
jgi:DNA-directed RNA polymerase sigma subunit (sigma70/sigma32)